MQGILIENKYVETEMLRRDFRVKDGCWTGGVLFDGDPFDDAELEDFLRRQFKQPRPAASDKVEPPKRTGQEITQRKLDAKVRLQAAAFRKAAAEDSRDRRDRASAQNLLDRMHGSDSDDTDDSNFGEGSQARACSFGVRCIRQSDSAVTKSPPNPHPPRSWTRLDLAPLVPKWLQSGDAIAAHYSCVKSCF